MFNKCSVEDENVDLFPLCKLNTCDVTFANCKAKVLKLLLKITFSLKKYMKVQTNPLSINVIWYDMAWHTFWYCVNAMPIAYWCLWVNSSLSLHSCVTWHLPIIHKVKWSLTLQNLYCIWWYMNIEQTCTAHYAVFCNKVKKVHQCNTLYTRASQRNEFWFSLKTILYNWWWILESSNVCIM